MRVSSQNRVTIPHQIRKKLGMLPGTEVEFVVIGDTAYLFKAETKDPVSVRDKYKPDSDLSPIKKS